MDFAPDLHLEDVKTILSRHKSQFMVFLNHIPFMQVPTNFWFFIQTSFSAHFDDSPFSHVLYYLTIPLYSQHICRNKKCTVHVLQSLAL